MYRGIICRHWQQICCSSRLYDGLFGEGSLRASANQARVLTWTSTLRVCAQPPTYTTRELFLFTSPLLALWFATPVSSLSPLLLRHILQLLPTKDNLNASRFVNKDTNTNPTASPSINMAYRVGMYMHLSQYYTVLRGLSLTGSEISATKQAGCQATHCKKEKVKIQKGEIRQGVVVDTGDFTSLKWRHW